MMKAKAGISAFFVLYMTASAPVDAIDFNIWWHGSDIPNFTDTRKACDFLLGSYTPSLTQYYAPQYNKFENGVFQCGMLFPGDVKSWTGNFHPIVLTCPEGSSLGVNTSCAFNVQKGNPQEGFLCSNISSGVGNPINAANGNKFQEEIDLKVGAVSPIIIARYYNSIDGVWRHSFSSSLYFSTDGVVLVNSDGREAIFQHSNEGYYSSTDAGLLTAQPDGWRYQEPSNRVLSFSSEGQLLSIDNVNGERYALAYQDLGADRGITVSNNIGQVVQLTEAPFHQLKKVVSDTITIDYQYSSMQLTTRTTTIGSSVKIRKYHYEDSRSRRLLTGITDERGVRFATWTYDGQYRALSSEHGDGAGLTQITYNLDGSSVVTNELGKQTVFRYQQISGVKRIVAIEGEPTPDCPASNSSYTYNDRGEVLTKTDAKGLITTYTYNDRGLETSRTEASGTPLARVVTTEWHTNWFLPVLIEESGRTTVYSYDDQGRELSRQTTSH